MRKEKEQNIDGGHTWVEQQHIFVPQQYKYKVKYLDKQISISLQNNKLDANLRVHRSPANVGEFNTAPIRELRN